MNPDLQSTDDSETIKDSKPKLIRKNIISPALSISIAIAVIVVMGFQITPIFDNGRSHAFARIWAIPYFALISVILLKRRLSPTRIDLVLIYLALIIAIVAIPFALSHP